MAVLTIPVQYKDDDVIVCEKPVGIPSESPGLPDLVADQTGRKVWPVHRLDQGTGGLIILAFSAKACTSLQSFFQRDMIKKEYLAVIAGSPPELSGRFEDILFHDRKKNKSFVVRRLRSGAREAVCEWTKLGTVNSGLHAVSLVRVSLHTGRTHQIRVQFASRGYPLVGDRKYGSHISAGSPALWASHIVFPHPCKRDCTVDVSSVPSTVYPWNLFSGSL